MELGVIKQSQAPLSVECQQATAFITSFGKYQSKRVPMGLKVTTTYFQDMMTRILGELVTFSTEVYLHDILTHATSEVDCKEPTRSIQKVDSRQH